MNLFIGNKNFSRTLQKTQLWFSLQIYKESRTLQVKASIVLVQVRDQTKLQCENIYYSDPVSMTS